ncbi:hypothetical protein, partial [Alkalibacillus haloalkaliphilus]|uniref:hypothetical protein n=1 Tax=Alkalibacillus haloalkaliphilus TaxID=94136 RepID=UPI001ED9803E
MAFAAFIWRSARLFGAHEVYLAFDHIYWRSHLLALTNFISVQDFLSALNLFYQRSVPVYQRSQLFIGVRTLFISAR